MSSILGWVLGVLLCPRSLSTASVKWKQAVLSFSSVGLLFSSWSRRLILLIPG